MKKMMFEKITTNATTPTRASPLSAGLDLCSAYDVTVAANDQMLIFTDLRVSIPDGYYGRIAPRSGLAVKHRIDVGAGVIDGDYR